jgi:hypothetical protein
MILARTQFASSAKPYSLTIYCWTDDEFTLRG